MLCQKHRVKILNFLSYCRTVVVCKGEKMRESFIQNFFGVWGEFATGWSVSSFACLLIKTLKFSIIHFSFAIRTTIWCYKKNLLKKLWKLGEREESKIYFGEVKKWFISLTRANKSKKNSKFSCEFKEITNDL
jgi:hypothetical protein